MPLTCFIQQLLDGREIGRFPSIHQAVKLSGLSINTITRSLNEPEVYYSAPFTWKYLFIRMPKKVKKVAPRPLQPEYKGLGKSDQEIDEIFDRIIIKQSYRKAHGKRKIL